MADILSVPVSIIIPTRNAGLEFRSLLEAIRRQTRECEIVVVDSGSTDGTPDAAREFRAQTILIPSESFNHGETRNLGIRNSKGQFCVMLVQDALPVDETWLEELISPLSDARVAGVFGRQIPRADSDALGRWQVEYRDRFLGREVRVQELDSWDQFMSLSQRERLRLVSFDNVNSVLRREVWEQNPFRPLAFAEDLDWGVRMIEAGRRIVYNPSACVVHSHSRPAAYHMRRSYLSGRIVPKLLRSEPTEAGARNDAEFLMLLGALCGEVRTLLTQGITDWRSFSKSCNIRHGIWKSFLVATGLRPSPPGHKRNPMRNDFYFVLDQLSEFSETADWNGLLVQALAEAIGSFTASYYNWCEGRQEVSKGMRRLDHALSRGV